MIRKYRLWLTKDNPHVMNAMGIISKDWEKAKVSWHNIHKHRKLAFKSLWEDVDLKSLGTCIHYVVICIQKLVRIGIGSFFVIWHIFWVTSSQTIWYSFWKAWMATDEDDPAPRKNKK